MSLGNASLDALPSANIQSLGLFFFAYDQNEEFF